jgi:hypothetical protein
MRTRIHHLGPVRKHGTLPNLESPVKGEAAQAFPERSRFFVLGFSVSPSQSMQALFVLSLYMRTIAAKLSGCSLSSSYPDEL